METLIDEAIERYKNNAEYERAHGNLQGCLDFRQLAEWLKELKIFKSRKGQWLRMSDLSEQEDDRYKCSRCGNVVRYKDKMNLYTFNSWCGRCGSDNGKHMCISVISAGRSRNFLFAIRRRNEGKGSKLLLGWK